MTSLCCYCIVLIKLCLVYIDGITSACVFYIWTEDGVVHCTVTVGSHGNSSTASVDWWQSSHFSWCVGTCDFTLTHCQMLVTASQHQSTRMVCYWRQVKIAVQFLSKYKKWRCVHNTSHAYISSLKSIQYKLFVPVLWRKKRIDHQRIFQFDHYHIRSFLAVAWSGDIY